VVKITIKDVSQNARAAIKLKFGETIGADIIAKLEQCISEPDRTSMANCVIDALDADPNAAANYSDPLKQEIWDFLYHFVIVG
jgi:hypothetical protein